MVVVWDEGVPSYTAPRPRASGRANATIAVVTAAAAAAAAVTATSGGKGGGTSDLNHLHLPSSTFFSLSEWVASM